MSVIDQALKANELYAKTYDPKWGAGPPKPKLAVVTCMDPRLSDLPGILGLKHADIDVIRTGGPAVTEDVLAELLVSTRPPMPCSLIGSRPTRPDKEDRNGSNPLARPSRFQIGAARRHGLEAVPSVPTFGPPCRRCRSAFRARAPT